MADAGAVLDYKMFFGARVSLPVDMADLKLKHCIELAKRHVSPVADWQAGGDAAVAAMKAELDSTYGPSWHVIAGQHFGSKVTHDSKEFCFFYVGDKAVLIFKCG